MFIENLLLLNNSIYLNILIFGTLISSMTLGNIPDIFYDFDTKSIKTNGGIMQVFAQDDLYYEKEYYYEDNPKHNQPVFTVNPVLCIGSGLFAADQDHCPIKCEDGTYIMQGMECPEDDEPPQTDETGQLTVIKNFNGCFQLPESETAPIDTDNPVSCNEIFILDPTPNNYKISVSQTEIPLEISFPGSSAGVNIDLVPGVFEVSEAININGQLVDFSSVGHCVQNGFELGTPIFLPNTDDIIMCGDLVGDCDGTISSNDNLECTINNIALLNLE